MKLYVCWGTFKLPVGREHPCREALDALKESGFDPVVINAHSYGALPRALQTPTRKRIADATGSPWVPALETDDGEWISGSEKIAEWAKSKAAVASPEQA